MKKGTIIHVVVMVVAVIAGTMLAIKLNNDQRALIPEKAELAASTSSPLTSSGCFL